MVSNWLSVLVGHEFELFVSDSFLPLLTPLTWVFFSFVYGRLQKNYGKRQRYLLTQNFIWKFTTILWRGTFPWTSRSSHASQTRPWNILVIYGDKSLKLIVYPVGVFNEVFLAETAANRTHNLQLSPGLSIHVCYSASSLEEDVLLISVVTAEVWENFSLVPGSLSFRHTRISLPVRELLGTATFFKTYLFYFLFLFY